MTEEEIQPIFKKRKRNFLIVVIMFGISAILFYAYLEINGLGKYYLLVGIIVLQIFIYLFHIIYWKCPNCNTILRAAIEIEKCPNCERNLVPVENAVTGKSAQKKEIATIETLPNIDQIENRPPFPNYEEYNIYDLVEIYQRIDHQRNKKERIIIEEHIRKNLILIGLLN